MWYVLILNFDIIYRGPNKPPRIAPIAVRPALFCHPKTMIVIGVQRHDIEQTRVSRHFPQDNHLICFVLGMSHVVAVV